MFAFIVAFILGVVVSSVTGSPVLGAVVWFVGAPIIWSAGQNHRYE